MLTRILIRPTLLAVAVASSGCATCARPVALSPDIRVSREFLETVAMFPVAVDVEIRQGDYLSITKRATIICEVPRDVVDFVTVRMETLELGCSQDTSAAAYVRPVDIEDFACEDLSRNGRETLRFEADPDIVLGEDINEDVFPQRADCRRSATMTLNIE